MDVSVVIPIHNEEPNLEALYRELTEAFSGWGRSYEIIFVDDGSTDESFSDPRAAPGGAIRTCASSGSAATSDRPPRSPPASRTRADG